MPNVKSRTNYLLHIHMLFFGSKIVSYMRVVILQNMVIGYHMTKHTMLKYALIGEITGQSLRAFVNKKRVIC